MFQDIDSEGPEPSDWDKYAAEEYEILVAEETANEQLHEGYTLTLVPSKNNSCPLNLVTFSHITTIT